MKGRPADMLSSALGINYRIQKDISGMSSEVYSRRRQWGMLQAAGIHARMDQGAIHAVLDPRLPCAPSSSLRPSSRSKVRPLIVAPALSRVLCPADLTDPPGGTPPFPCRKNVVDTPLFRFLQNKRAVNPLSG